MSAYFEYYKVFYYVAHCRSITGAAEKLALTQPSVTRAIKNLESQLGLTLFIRSKQGVALTPEGQKLFERVAPACEQFFAAEEELAQIKDMEYGLIRIGIDNAVIRSGYFLRILKEFREKYPRIHIKLEHSMLSFQQDLTEGGLDCCFLSGMSNMQLIPSLARRTLYPYDDVIVVGKSFASFAGRELCLRDLVVIPAINFDQMDLTAPFSNAKSDDLKSSRFVSMDVSTLDFQIQLAKAGFGYTFVPRLCVEEELRNGTLFELTLNDFTLGRAVELVTPTDRPLSHAAQKFIRLFTDKDTAELI